MEFSICVRSLQSKTCSNGLTLKKFNNSFNKQLQIVSYSAPSSRKSAIFSSATSPSTANSDVSLDGGAKQVPVEKTSPPPTFPSGLQALILDVCDETEIAELKVKIGTFEMHLKRSVGAVVSPMSSISPTEPLPIPSKPMDLSDPVAASPPQAKPAPAKTNPFTNVSFGRPSKLEALEASGATGYVLVVSPTVGSFRRGRTFKGKKQPPVCKEGDLIKEGQVIGYVDQFGSDLPVKSDVAGEVVKLLFDDGDPIGYGDPLIAVLPSFHGINT